MTPSSNGEPATKTARSDDLAPMLLGLFSSIVTQGIGDLDPPTRVLVAVVLAIGYWLAKGAVGSRKRQKEDGHERRARPRLASLHWWAVAVPLWTLAAASVVVAAVLVGRPTPTRAVVLVVWLALTALGVWLSRTARAWTPAAVPGLALSIASASVGATLVIGVASLFGGSTPAPGADSIEGRGRIGGGIIDVVTDDGATRAWSWTRRRPTLLPHGRRYVERLSEEAAGHEVA